MMIAFLKNVKSHRKLNLFKCPKFYRTNCDLLMISVLLQILVLLVTVINCSEFQLMGSGGGSARPSDTSGATSSARSPNSSSFSSSSSSFSANLEKDDPHRPGSVQINSTMSSVNMPTNRVHSNDGERLIAFSKDQENVGRARERAEEEQDDDDEETDDELDTIKLQQIIMQGLGLKTLPDASKMNISQDEYVTKYNEYLQRVRERKKRELLQHYTMEYLEEVLNPVTLYSIKHNSSIAHLPYERARRRRRATAGTAPAASNHDVIYVRFPIDLDSSEVPGDIEEATIRLLLNAKHHSHHHAHRKHHNRLDPSAAYVSRTVTLKVYQLIEPYGRVWLDSRTVEFDNPNMSEQSSSTSSTSRWIELDVSKAVDSWLVAKQSNLGLEIVCDRCHEHNIYIMDDTSANSEPDMSPVLNIVGRFGVHREKRSRQHHHFMQASRRKPRKTDCVQENNKCCRHKMDVIFSEIKGYDFIIQPKTFDAGYCRGRCPPRYNPAHQHAFFQSLIWKQDKSKVPRPCCAPSKLAELEVLHVDEKNRNKLQVSVWKDMRVQECACS